MISQRKTESNKQNWAKATRSLKMHLKNRINDYLKNPNHCKKCNNILEYKKRKNKFCNSSCAASFTNIGRIRSNKSKEKTKASIANYYNSLPKRFNYCIECEDLFVITWKTSRNKFCSNKCRNKSRKRHGTINGRKSAAIQAKNKRSKNESLFAVLCAEYFGNIKTNEPIFNGWDADVIIENLKIAVLWNGVWHYKKITKKHSVNQVQNRDKIKIKEIKKAGYTPYIIKDMGSYNPSFVKEEFKKFIGNIA